TEIKIRESDKKVFIFTCGRGTWTADFNLTSSNSPSKNNINASVYPNPFHGEMTIEFEKELNATVEMIDVQGKLCLRKTFMGKKVNVQTEDLKTGIYSIEVFEGDKIIFRGKGIRVAYH